MTRVAPGSRTDHLRPAARAKGHDNVQEGLHALRRALRAAALETRSFAGAVEAAGMLGHLNWMNNDGLLSEEPLEAALLERHRKLLEGVGPCVSPAESEAWDWLHVITEAYDHGGHTLLLENLLQGLSRRSERQVVAVTRSAAEGFAGRAEATGTALRRLSGEDPLLRAQALLALGRQSSRIVLHIHPDDITSALAARALCEEGRTVLFVNHADHVFSYGPGAAEAVLEISAFGWRLTSARRAARDQRFLGIPVEAPAAPPPPAPGGPILSMGSPHKYRPAPGGLSFPDFLLKLLPRTDRNVELIGPRASDPWWTEVRARHPDRVRFHGLLPFEQANARLAAAGAYVDSFPTNGGTAFPQALMAGRTVFGIGGDEGGYGLAEALRSPSPEAMLEDLLHFLETGKAPPLQDEIRRRIGEEFSIDAVTGRLLQAAAGRPSPLPDALAAAPRGLDQQVEIWRKRGEAVVSLRPARSLSLARRLAIARRMSGPNSPTRRAGRRALARWILRGA